MENNYNSEVSNANLLDDDFYNLEGLKDTGVAIRNVKATTSEKKPKSKFIFTKPLVAQARLKKQETDTINTTFRKFKKVTFNEGDIVEGVVIVNRRRGGLRPNSLMIDVGDAVLEIGFGGNRDSVIKPYSEPTIQSVPTKEEVKTPEETKEEVKTTDDSFKMAAPQDDDKIFGMSKGLAIGLGIALAIGGFLAYKKFSK